MKYLSTFSGIGGFEIGINKAYEDLQNRGNNTNSKQKEEQYTCGNKSISKETQEADNSTDNEFITDTKNTSGTLLQDRQEQSNTITRNLEEIEGNIETRQQIRQGSNGILSEGSGIRDREESIWNTGDKPNIINNKELPICIGYSEINKYADQIYQSKFPEHKNYGDITKINAKELPDFDLFVGGFPCQAFSIAGKRGGFDDTRGTLFFDCARILKEKQPRNFILENVKGLLSHDNGRTFKTIINTLTELGYCVEWQVLNAKNFGVPQNRERVFIVGHLGGIPERKVFPITGTDREVDETSGVQSVSNPRELSRTLLARDYKDPKVVQVADYRNDEGLRIRSEPISPCLSARRTSATDISTMPPIVIKYKNPNGRFGSTNQVYDEDGISTCLSASMGMGGGYVPLVEKPETRIRRLTPLECERLMAYPDGWTEGLSDTQRYKTLGNGIVSNVVAEVVKRLYN